MPLIRPDLERMIPPVRTRLQALERKVIQALADPNFSGNMADLLGRLGQLYQVHHLDREAIAAYRNAVVYAPADARWPFYLGELLERQGSLDDALRVYRQLLVRHPEDATVLVRVAALLLVQNQLEEADSFLAQAEKLSPDEPITLFTRGRWALSQSRFGEAAKLFERILAQQPRATIVHYQLARAYRGLGDRDRAERHLRLRGDGVVEIRDTRHMELLFLATEMVIDLAAVLVRDAKAFSTHDLRGYFFTQFAENPHAEEIFQGAARFREDPQHPDATESAGIHFLLALLAESRGHRSVASQHYEKSLEHAPKFVAAHFSLGKLGAGEGRWQQTLARMNQVLRLAPDHQSARLERATALSALGRREPALEDLRLLARDSRLAGQAHLRMGEILLDDGEKSVVHFEKAVQAELPAREKARAFSRLGDVYRAKNLLAKAETAYRRALDLDSGRQETKFNLAGVLGNLERYGEAAALFAEVSVAEPENLGAFRGEYAALLWAAEWTRALSRLEAVAARLGSKYPSLNHLLARFLAAAPQAELRDGERALSLALRVHDQTPSMFSAESLAMALAQAGRSAEAAMLQENLLNKVTANGDQATAAWLRENLVRYQRGETCCAGSYPAVLLPALPN